MRVRRLIVYLLLTTVISVVTALGVVWLWELTHPEVPVALGFAFTATPPAPDVTANSPTLQAEAPTQEPLPTPTIYIVKSGDSLGSIAAEFDLPVDEIMAANDIIDPNLISVGQALVIPVPGSVPPTAEPGTAAPVDTAVIEPPRPTATRDPSVALPRLTIREVQSAGVLAEELLVIVNSGGPVDLDGWSLRDETGHTYTFPSLMLFEGGAVAVHTAPGTDSVTDLYWGQAEPVWAAGKEVLLSDASGNLHTRFAIP